MTGQGRERTLAARNIQRGKHHLAVGAVAGQRCPQFFASCGVLVHNAEVLYADTLAPEDGCARCMPPPVSGQRPPEGTAA